MPRAVHLLGGHLPRAANTSPGYGQHLPQAANNSPRTGLPRATTCHPPMSPDRSQSGRSVLLASSSTLRSFGSPALSSISLAVAIGGAIGVLLILIVWLYGLVGWVFFAIQVGNTGASPGMRIVGPEMCQVSNRSANRRWHGRCPCHSSLCRRNYLLCGLPVATLGRSEADACGQDHEDRRDHGPQAGFQHHPTVVN